MKKVFFAFAVVAGLAMTACNNKPAETEAPKTDSVVTTTTTEAVAPVDTTAKVDSAAAPAAETKTETKKVEEKK